MQDPSTIATASASRQVAGTAPCVAAVADGPLAGMTREFHNLLSDIEDLIKSTTSLTGEDLTRARAKLNARVAAARESVEEASRAVAGRARDAAKATDSYVHAQPWQAVGIGAAVGFVLGFVLARRA